VGICETRAAFGCLSPTLSTILPLRFQSIIDRFDRAFSESYKRYDLSLTQRPILNLENWPTFFCNSINLIRTFESLGSETLGDRRQKESSNEDSKNNPHFWVGCGITQGQENKWNS
jgi:hypothetical protein